MPFWRFTIVKPNVMLARAAPVNLKVSVVEIGQYMAERAAVAATEIRLAAQPKLKDIG